MEKGALFLEGAAQDGGIGQIAVVRESHPSLIMIDEQRLGVEADVRAGRCITHVPDGDAARSQQFQTAPVKNVIHEPGTAVRLKDPVPADHDPGAFLSAVLQGIEPVVHQRRQLPAFAGTDPEKAAFFADMAPAPRIRPVHRRSLPAGP